MSSKEEKNAEEILHHRRTSSPSDAPSPRDSDDSSLPAPHNDSIETSSTSSLWEQPPFSVDERVFCRGQAEDTIYQAVIKKVRRNHPTNEEENQDHNWSFWVHYLGWNARWDHWMTSNLILKNTTENQALFEQQERRQEEKRRREQMEAEDKKRRTKSRRRQCRQSTTDLPFTLQTVLVEECERITRTGWDSMHGYDFERTLQTTSGPPSCSYKKPARVVHNLPAAVPIRKLLSHFARKKIKSLEGAKEMPLSDEAQGKSPEESKTTTEQQELTADQVQAFCHQLGQLFQEALPVCLLYPQERPQYDLLVDNKKNVLDVYGCEYLLRLYVRLPEVQDVFPTLWNELLVLMQKNRQALFKGSSYREAEPEEWLEWERQVYGKTKK